MESMNRRDLLLAASAAVSTFVAPRAHAAPASAKSGGRLTRAASIIKPRRLKHGDLIGLVAPSGGSNSAYVEARVKHLEGLGFRVKLSKNILAVRGNTAGTPQQRVSDLHEMFLDREVDAIWALRGGSGASQMLPLIDYRLIRNNPKIFIGFSDITALHLAILKHSGLVTFHGPTAPGPTISDYSMTQLEAVLMHPRDQTTIYMSDKNRVESESAVAGAAEYRIRTVTAGVAEGRLVGGNLAVLSALIGTPYAPDWRGALLFLEEIREAPYRIDRMLTQLKQSIPFNDAAGVMLGVFRRSMDAGAPTDSEPRLSLEQAIDDHFAGLRVPTVYGFSFGHITNNFTIPLGVRARLDAGAQSLTLLEAAVSDR
jgi:muramoyltetrapeptide carboxypeptidase